MSTKLKVAFLVTSLNPGGIEHYLLRFITHYKGEIDATVYCKSGKTGTLHEKYKAVGVKIIPYKLSFFNLISYYKFYKQLKLNTYNSICDFTGNFATLPLLSAKYAGIEKRLVFFRGATNHFKETPFKLFYNFIMNRGLPTVSTTILSNSKAAINHFYPKLHKRNPEKFKIIYNGINVKSFLNTSESLRRELAIPENAFVVGHVGRYNIAKNHKTIIDVAVELCKTNTDTYFILCGKDVVNNLQQKVQVKNATSQIKLLDFRDDVIKVLNSLDCFYFPSITEGQPNALIEAMVVGVPFVASNIPSIKETVPKKLHSQLIPPMDITLAIKKIKEIKNKENSSKFKSLGNTTATIYNSNVLFGKFYKELS